MIFYTPLMRLANYHCERSIRYNLRQIQPTARSTTQIQPTARYNLLPAAAERLIELHKRRQHVPLRLSELLFGGQPLALGVEHFQIAADAADVTRVREPALIAQRLGEERLAAPCTLCSSGSRSAHRKRRGKLR